MENLNEIYNNVKEWYNEYQNPLTRNKSTVKTRISGYINSLPSDVLANVLEEGVNKPITSSHFDGDVDCFLMMLKCKLK